MTHLRTPAPDRFSSFQLEAARSSLHGSGTYTECCRQTLNNFQLGDGASSRNSDTHPTAQTSDEPQKERKTWFLFRLVSKSGNRCDAVYLDIKRPRPSRNVNEYPRRRVLREEPNVNFIHGGKLLDGRAVNVALSQDLIQRRAGRLEAKLHMPQDDFSLSVRSDRR